MKLDLSDEELEMLRDALDAAIDELGAPIDNAGFSARQVLRERRVTMRWLRKKLSPRSSR
jgi:hypothetical protein